MTEELKPCKCGTPGPELSQGMGVYANDMTAWKHEILCRECGETVHGFDTPQLAEEAWNNRDRKD